MRISEIATPGQWTKQSAALRLFDCDQHYYEPADCLTRHMNPPIARHNFRWLDTPDGGRRLIVKDRLLRKIVDPTFGAVALPGAQVEMYKQGKGKDYAASAAETVPISPEYRDRDARLRLLDEQGVEHAWLFPTLGVVIEELIKDDIPLVVETFRSFNRWIDDDWGFHYKERIFAAGYITLVDRDAAIRELEWLLSRGCRVIHLRPSPIAMVGGDGRSPADPWFDPFWARVAEADVMVTSHGGDSGWFDASAAWGEMRNCPTHMITNFMSATHGFRDIFTMLGSMVLHGLFTRFPTLKVASVEQGSDWVGFLLQRLHHVRARPDRYGVTGDPVEMFLRNVYIAPYPEDDIPALSKLIGSDHVLFGSDFPHPEGTATPLGFLDELARMDLADVRRIAGENARGLMHLQ